MSNNTRGHLRRFFITIESRQADFKYILCEHSIRISMKFSCDPYYEPTIVVHDIGTKNSDIQTSTSWL